MYEAFFGFREKPFTLLPDPAYLFLSRQHRMALVHLEYGLLHRAGFIVVSGEVGTGKTTLVKTLLGRLDDETEVASIFNTTVNPEELLDLVLHEFGLNPSGAGRGEKLDLLHNFLIDGYARKRKQILIIDEAQNLGIESLEEIRLLSNLQTEKEYLLQIILVGQPELRKKLNHPALVQLAQRIAVHYHLSSLSENETRRYIGHRLSVASGKDEPLEIFTDEAVAAIFQHTGGIPRLINLLCDSCLVHAFAEDVKIVGGSMVVEVVKTHGEGGLSPFASPVSGEDEKGRQNAAAAGMAEAENARNIATLEKRVGDLQDSVQLLNRLILEHLGDHHPLEKIAPGADPVLTERLEEQRMQIRHLKEERDSLMRRLDRLVISESGHNEVVVSETAAGSGKHKGLWRWLTAKPR